METPRVASAGTSWRIPLGMGLFALFTASLSLVVAGGSLNGYGFDGGVYLGAATRLAHGTLPYKDFVFVHPPGILLLLSPLAGGSWIFGTGFEVVAGRVFDLALIGLACGLGAAILQRLGTAAALIGGSFLALVGAAASVATQLELEPPLIAALFAMMLLSFRDATTIAWSRRLAIGGAFGGLALSIKLWALVPLGILMVVIFWRHRSAVRPFLLGLGTAAGVIVLPFLLISPGGFARDVIAAQVGRSAGGEHTPGIFGRLDYLAYYVLRPLAPHTSGFGVVLLLVLVLLGLDVFLRRRTLVLLEIVLYLCVPGLSPCCCSPPSSPPSTPGISPLSWHWGWGQVLSTRSADSSNSSKAPRCEGSVSSDSLSLSWYLALGNGRSPGHSSRRSTHQARHHC